MSGLLASEISKRYGHSTVALDRASIRVQRGEVIALVGPNGSGKSTLVRSIMGLERMDGGRVTFDGASFRAIKARRYLGVGYASQETAISELLTVRQNIELWLRLRRARHRRLRARVDELLTTFGLTTLRHRRADALSGGEKRRLHVALAFIDCRDLLVLDEPTLGADLASTDGILEEVRHAATVGAAVLVTTHNVHELACLRAAVVPIVDGHTRSAVPFDRFSKHVDRFRSEIRSLVVPGATVRQRL